jgi:hypothetical protein
MIYDHIVRSMISKSRDAEARGARVHIVNRFWLMVGAVSCEENRLAT